MKKQCANPLSYRPRIWKNERANAVWAKEGKGKLDKVWEEVTWPGEAWSSDIMKRYFKRKIPQNAQDRQRQSGKDVCESSSGRSCISFGGKTSLEWFSFSSQTAFWELLTWPSAILFALFLTLPTFIFFAEAQVRSEPCGLLSSLNAFSWRVSLKMKRCREESFE